MNRKLSNQDVRHVRYLHTISKLTYSCASKKHAYHPEGIIQEIAKGMSLTPEAVRAPSCVTKFLQSTRERTLG